MTLCVQTDLELFLQIVFTNQPNDPTVDYLISAADGLIKDEIGYDPEQDAAIVEIHDPSHTFDLWVRRPPINSVTEIQVDGTVLTASQYAAYLEDEDKSGLLRRIGARWSGQARGIQVTYDGGYAVIPTPLRDASVRIAARSFQKGAEFSADENTPGVTSIALAGSDSITWSESANNVALGALELTGAELGMISRYKRNWVA